MTDLVRKRRAGGMILVTFGLVPALINCLLGERPSLEMATFLFSSGAAGLIEVLGMHSDAFFKTNLRCEHHTSEYLKPQSGIISVQFQFERPRTQHKQTIQFVSCIGSEVHRNLQNTANKQNA